MNLSTLHTSAQDYYPFGSLEPDRTYSSANYRFGFNGKENDNEVKGTGNQQDYGMRIYDPRLGRFLSVDPLTKDYPWYTPYQFAGNKPIMATDLDGLEENIAIYYGKNKDGSPTLVSYAKWSAVFPGEEHGPISSTGTLTYMTDRDFLNSTNDFFTGHTTRTMFTDTDPESGKLIHASWVARKDPWSLGTGGLHLTWEVGCGEETRSGDGSSVDVGDIAMRGFPSAKSTNPVEILKRFYEGIETGKNILEPFFGDEEAPESSNGSSGSGTKKDSIYIWRVTKKMNKWKGDNDVRSEFDTILNDKTPPTDSQSKPEFIKSEPAN